MATDTLHGWVTEGEARALWADAPRVDDTLGEVLDAAYSTVLAYAPDLPVTDPPTLPPANYKLAQVMQARAVWQAARRDTGDVVGLDENGAVRVRPLDPAVRTLLRPPSPSHGLVG